MTVDPASLLADLGWLRRLARRLARDPELAEDLVQDTCAAALQQPTPPHSWRAWLATVMANLMRRHHHREKVREHWHRAANRRDGADDAATLLQRAEAQRLLTELVLRLDEPYRTTVLLRFFDGLPPRRIASQLGVPVATVNSRLQRALNQLRGHLDQHLGGCGQWLATFAPFAWPTSGSAGTFGILAMQTKLKVVVALVALACSAPLWWPDAIAGSALPPTDQHASRRPTEGGGGGGGGATGGGDTTLAHARTDLTPHATPSPAPVRFHLGGTVRDCSGKALANVAVTTAGDRDVSHRSDSLGRFELEVAAERATLVAAEATFVTVLQGEWAREATIEPVVVVAPAIAFAGRVLDADGAPVPGSALALQLPADFDTRFAVPLDRAGSNRWQTRGGDDGSFSLPRLPAIDGSQIIVTADAFAPATVPVPATATNDAVIVLQHFHFREGELRGHVLDPAGAPVAGARVAMGVTSVVSDRDGSFGLSLLRAGWPTAIVAAKAGYAPARQELPAGGGTQRDQWPASIELRLGNAPEPVRGRVVDQDQHFLAGAEVWIADPTPLGIAGMMPMQLEYVVAGGEVPAAVQRRPVPHADDPTSDENFMDQASAPRSPSAGWYFVTTDAQGDFVLPGLLDRSYQLRALDPTTGLFGEVADATAGSFQTIVIARDGVWPVLRGRVLSRAGHPLAGIRVQQNVLAFQVRARVPGGRFEGSAQREGRSTVTAADGSFELHDVGHHRAFFTLSGDSILPAHVEGDHIQDPTNCTLTAEARCHVEVALLDPDEADSVACRDADGQQLDLAVLRDNSNSFTTDLPLHGGRSGVFVVGERAAELVLRKNDQPVRRIPIAPDTRQTLTVQ